MSLCHVRRVDAGVYFVHERLLSIRRGLRCADDVSNHFTKRVRVDFDVLCALKCLSHVGDFSDVAFDESIRHQGDNGLDVVVGGERFALFVGEKGVEHGGRRAFG